MINFCLKLQGHLIDKQFYINICGTPRFPLTEEC